MTRPAATTRRSRKTVPAPVATRTTPKARTRAVRPGRPPAIKIERRTSSGGREIVSVAKLAADTGLSANYLRLLLRHGRGKKRKGATQRAVSDIAARALTRYLGWSDKKVRQVFGGRIDVTVAVPAKG